MDIFYRCSRIFEEAGRGIQVCCETCDETIWRTDGKNRCSKFPHAVFGNDPLPWAHVVDRYGGYNKPNARFNTLRSSAPCGSGFGEGDPAIAL
ncbi:MAG: hypothetical protein ACP5VS_00225 [Desulfomonilaceae bacterium]